jgi:hypothetical protein
MTTTSAQDAGTRPSLGLPIDGSLSPILGSFSAFSASQGPSARRHASSHRGLGAPQRCPLGTALPTAPPTGTRKGCDTRRQTPPRLQRLWGSWARMLAPRASLLRHQKPREGAPGEAGPSRHDMTRSVSEKSSRTTPRDSLAPQHRHGPQSAATRPS